MKLHIYKWICSVFIAATLGPLYQAIAQTTYSVPITLSVNSTGINRFIASQWSGGGFTWTETDNNVLVYYSNLRLDSPPIVILATNKIKIRLSIKVDVCVDLQTGQPIYLNRNFIITPMLTFPTTMTNSDNICAQYADLSSAVDNAIDNPKVRSIVKQKLGAINWIMYKGKILKIPSSPLNKVSGTDRLYWNITPPTLTFKVYGGELDLTVTPTIVAN
jgi:hypothetical protein